MDKLWLATRAVALVQLFVTQGTSMFASMHTWFKVSDKVFIWNGAFARDTFIFAHPSNYKAKSHSDISGDDGQALFPSSCSMSQSHPKVNPSALTNPLFPATLLVHSWLHIDLSWWVKHRKKNTLRSRSIGWTHNRYVKSSHPNECGIRCVGFSDIVLIAITFFEAQLASQPSTWQLINSRL
jgi:hypothetical protein